MGGGYEISMAIRPKAGSPKVVRSARDEWESCRASRGWVEKPGKNRVLLGFRDQKIPKSDLIDFNGEGLQNCTPMPPKAAGKNTLPGRLSSLAH